jgi:hypothetical protein
MLRLSVFELNMHLIKGDIFHGPNVRLSPAKDTLVLTLPASLR